MPWSPREALIAWRAASTSSGGTAPGSWRNPSWWKVCFCATFSSTALPLERLLELLADLIAAAALPLLDRVIQRGEWLPPGHDGGDAVEAELGQLGRLGDVGRRIQRPARIVDAHLHDFEGHLLRWCHSIRGRG